MDEVVDVVAIGTVAAEPTPGRVAWSECRAFVEPGTGDLHVRCAGMYQEWRGAVPQVKAAPEPAAASAEAQPAPSEPSTPPAVAG